MIALIAERAESRTTIDRRKSNTFLMQINYKKITNQRDCRSRDRFVCFLFKHFVLHFICIKVLYSLSLIDTDQMVRTYLVQQLDSREITYPIHVVRL